MSPPPLPDVDTKVCTADDKARCRFNRADKSALNSPNVFNRNNKDFWISYFNSNSKEWVEETEVILLWIEDDKELLVVALVVMLEKVVLP